jgi:hypothetical protein
MVNLKHVGRMKSSSKRVLVAFSTLPGDAYSCLVVPTERLDDSYHNAIINLVESASAQEAYEFAEALDRTQFPDGSRMLPSLHSKGLLIKSPTSEVEMIPSVGVSVLLSELNQIIAEQRGIAIDDLHIRPSSQDNAEVREVASVNKILATANETEAVTESLAPATEPVTFDSPEAEAKHYRSQADKLAKEAANFRRLAEELVPAKKKKNSDTVKEETA